MNVRLQIVLLLLLMSACAAHRRPPEIPLTDPVEAHRVAEPSAPMKIVEMPQALALPGQLKPIDREADYLSLIHI